MLDLLSAIGSRLIFGSHLIVSSCEEEGHGEWVC